MLDKKNQHIFLFNSSNRKTSSATMKQINILQMYYCIKMEKSIISFIINSSGETVHQPQEMNDDFKSFYSNLYSSEHDTNQSDIDFFKNI